MTDRTITLRSDLVERLETLAGRSGRRWQLGARSCRGDGSGGRAALAGLLRELQSPRFHEGFSGQLSVATGYDDLNRLRYSAGISSSGSSESTYNSSLYPSSIMQRRIA
jgi:hypothetical protein